MSVHDIDYFLILTSACLMKKVWKYSHLLHVDYFEPKVGNVCKKNLERCIEALNEVWDIRVSCNCIALVSI